LLGGETDEDGSRAPPRDALSLPQTLSGPFVIERRVLDPTYDALAAGHHANEFDSIAFREKTLHPFSLVKRGGIVLD
jgi:hypothetical protein